MPLEKKVQTFEGLKLAVGPRPAIYYWARFHHLYPEKHGSCLEFIHQNPDNPRAFSDYTRREEQVWARYALFCMHTYQRLQLAASYSKPMAQILPFPKVLR